jgi:hypothetical protein
MMINSDQNAVHQADQESRRPGSFYPQTGSAETNVADLVDRDTMRVNTMAPTPGFNGSPASAVLEAQTNSLNHEPVPSKRGKPRYPRSVITAIRGKIDPPFNDEF